MAADVVIARIGKPHGIRGEVTVEVRTDDPNSRLGVGAKLETEPRSAGPLVVATHRLHNGITLLGFEGVADRNGAEALRGTLLVADAIDDESDDDAWHVEQLRGLAVYLPSGERIGTITDLVLGPAQDLLHLETMTGEDALVPFVIDIVPEIDVDAGRLIIDPPGGLIPGVGPSTE